MDNMTNFVGLSAVLTGFNKTIIAPSLDPVDIKSTYLGVWTESIPSSRVSSILGLYEKLSSKKPALSDKQVGGAMLDDSNGAEFVMACRQLIFLWYMGAWPKVDEIKKTTSFTTISSASYTAGLVWKVMQSHPMGDSNYRYGYWETPPVSLDKYTGNPEPKNPGNPDPELA